MEFEQAREAIVRHPKRTDSDFTPYFHALYCFELAISSTAQTFQFIRKISELQGRKQNLYEHGDGSEIERLDRIYSSATKHIETSTLTGDEVDALWLSNTGVHSSAADVTWEEIARMVQEVGNAAYILVNEMMK